MLQSKYGSIWKKKKKKDSVEICSCNTTKTTEIIAKDNLHPWWGILGRRELHRPCYFPLDLTGSMQMRKSNTRLFSCPRCPCQIRNSPLVINFHSSKASYRGKKKSDRQSATLSLSWESSWFRLTKVHKYSWTPSSLWSRLSLSPLDIFGVGSLCQTGIIGTLARVTLARRPRGSRLAVRAGVSRLALGSGLSWASIFAVPG